jgi:plasmid maintenance system antidote protein VapI
VSLADDVRGEVLVALHATRTSQAELARRLQISSKHVNQVLLGRAALSLDLAERMLAEVGYRLTVRAEGVDRGVPRA